MAPLPLASGGGGAEGVVAASVVADCSALLATLVDVEVAAVAVADDDVDVSTAEGAVLSAGRPARERTVFLEEEQPVKTRAKATATATTRKGLSRRGSYA